METQRIDGVPGLFNDSELLAVLHAKSDPWGHRGKAEQIAIAGPDGRIYRTVMVYGPHEVLQIFRALQDRGLVERSDRGDFFALFCHP